MQKNNNKSCILSLNVTRGLVFLILVEATFIVTLRVNEDAGAIPEDDMIRQDCVMSKSIGVNDLSINDVVARDPETGIVYIKAKFSLAIKVETIGEKQPVVNTGTTDNGFLPNGDVHGNHSNGEQPNGVTANGKLHENRRQLIGYLPLDSVLKVGDLHQSSDNDQLLVIKFKCGLLKFQFAKDKGYFVSKITGAVNLDPNTSRHFESTRPVFMTKDLDHHFRQNSLIEVVSEVNTKSYVLIANFFNTELEAFRNTTSRDFVLPPEEEAEN